VKYADGKDTVSTLKYLAGKLFILLILSTPGILFMILFYANVQFHPAGDSYSAGVLIKWINDARPFIVFNYTGEEIITEQFFHILLVLLALSFILKNRDTQNRRNLEKINILAIPLLLSIFLYFITPNGSGAGMMSDRYGLILYFFGLIWIVSRSVNIKFNHVIIFLVLILHFGLHFKHLAGSLGKLDANAISINEAGKSISENSIVLPVNLSDHWLELHFSNYSGTDKPIIILENYEAGTGWFPVRWNSTNFPNIRLNDKDSISGLQWMNNRKSGYVKEVDYILIYGNPAKLDNPEWSELKEVLSAGFTLKYRAENDYVLLYKRSY